MANTELSRRGFIQGSGLAALGLVGLPGLEMLKKEGSVQERVEYWRQTLEDVALVADNSLVKISRVVHDPFVNYSGYNWIEAPEKIYPPEVVRVRNVEFNVVGIEVKFIQGSRYGDEDFYVFEGHIPNMTGDPSRWKTEVGYYYPNINRSEGGLFHFVSQPAWGDGTEDYPGVEERYGTSVHRSWYDSKVGNVLIGLDDFRRNAVRGIAPGEEFSFLETIDLRKHLLAGGDRYFLGRNSQGAWVPGGGVCGFATVVAKTVHRAVRRGINLEVTEIKGHSSGPYYVNWEDRDTVDATTAIVSLGEGGTVVDYRFINRTDRSLYFYPKVDLIIPQIPEGRKLPSSMDYPSTVKFLMSMTLTDREPTLETSQSVEDAKQAFMAYRAEYGEGYNNGFNS